MWKTTQKRVVLNSYGSSKSAFSLFYIKRVSWDVFDEIDGWYFHGGNGGDCLGAHWNAQGVQCSHDRRRGALIPKIKFIGKPCPFKTCMHALEI